MLLPTFQIFRWFPIALMLALLTACGGGGGGGGGSSPTPVALTAKISASDTTPRVENNINLNASASTGSIANYTWTFDDGSSVDGVTTTKAFSTEGDHTVGLRVTDTEGKTANSSIIITVLGPNQSPTASFTVDNSSDRYSLTATFDASASSDADGNIANYAWDFGDGQTGSGQMVSHTFTTQNTFAVSLTVTDNEGSQATATPITVTVLGDNIAPTISSFVARQTGDNTVQFSVTANDTDGNVASYLWDFGDGNTSTAASPQHTYTMAGSEETFAISVSVTDNEGTHTDSGMSDLKVVSDLKRIMVLGDSISHGQASNPSYRYRLWKKLIENDSVVDFVGTVSTLAPVANPVACSQIDCPDIDVNDGTSRLNLFDPDHQAKWGILASTVANDLPTYFSNAVYNNPVDVVLIHLGTNDLRANAGPTAARDAISSIIGQIRTKFGNQATIYVAKIIPQRSDQPGAADIASFNSLLDGLAASDVVVVDQNTGFDPSTQTYDGVHPNSSGEELIAQRWYNAIIGSL